MHTTTAPPHGKPKLYNPRHPERTLLCQTVAEHYETWLDLASAGQFDGQGDHRTPKPYVCKAFRKYLDCGVVARGFARARCGDCGHDYFVAFSCKGRGVCPLCNTRRMVEPAAHLTDHVFPRLPVRQWVLSVPKRLRYFIQRDGAVLNMVLRIFLRVIAQSLQSNSAGAVNVDKATLHIGAAAFIHRFGSSLNEHVQLRLCVVDGGLEELADIAQSPAQPGLAGAAHSISTRAALTAQTRSTPRLGAADCPHLRGVPAGVPPMRRAYAHHKHSSPIAPISGTSSITSGWSQSPRTLPRLAGHRCGKKLMRRRLRAPKSCPIGTGHHKRHRTTRWTSASTGDSVKRRFAKLRGAAACAVKPNLSAP
jgi:hypothetical protein